MSLSQNQNPLEPCPLPPPRRRFRILPAAPSPLPSPAGKHRKDKPPCPPTPLVIVCLCKLPPFHNIYKLHGAADAARRGDADCLSSQLQARGGSARRETRSQPGAAARAEAASSAPRGETRRAAPSPGGGTGRVRRVREGLRGGNAACALGSRWQGSRTQTSAGGSPRAGGQGCGRAARLPRLAGW